MFYAIIFLIIFSIILLVADYKNKYSWLFFVMVTGMVISLFSIVMHISALGNYYSLGCIFKLDYRIYQFMAKQFKIPLSTNARLMNAGIVLYLLSVPLFVYEFRKNISNDTIFYEKNVVKLLFLVLLPVFYLWFYDPVEALDFYLLYHSNTRSAFLTGVITVIHGFNKVWVFLYLFYPVLILYRQLRETPVMFVKKQIFSLAICLGVMNTLFYWIFFTGPFMMSTTKVFTSGFWIFENIQTVSHRYFMRIPLITLVVLQFMLVILLNFRMGSLIHLFTDKKIQKNLTRINEVLSDTFHTHKNTLFSINILAKQALDSPDGMAREETLNKIQQITSVSLYRTSEMLDSLREIRYRFIKNRVNDVIDEALKKVNIPSNIRIIWNRDEESDKYICKFDFYHISKVLVNILNNSIEAIQHADREQGLIEIMVTVQFQWVMIMVKDNGIGIKKVEPKKLFSPWHSGREGFNNWGLGLSYVYKVVKAHLGFVRIDSKYNEYTLLQILLPRPK